MPNIDLKIWRFENLKMTTVCRNDYDKIRE